jgi:hypothetical protein
MVIRSAASLVAVVGNDSTVYLIIWAGESDIDAKND